MADSFSDCSPPNPASEKVSKKNALFTIHKTCTALACISADFISADLAQSGSPEPVLSEAWPNLNSPKVTGAQLQLPLEGFLKPAEAAHVFL